MSFDELFEHVRHFALVGDAVLGDDGGGQTTQHGVVQRCNLAARDRLQHVRRLLRARVADVDVGSVVQKQFHDLQYEYVEILTTL